MKSIKSKTKTIIIICLVAACALIVSIGGVLSQWVIIPLIKGTPEHVYGDSGETDVNVEVDTNEGFISSSTFSGKVQEPTPKEAVFGADYVRNDGGETGYTLTWTGCKLVDSDKITTDKAYAGLVAGTHYYKIKDNATGQIISKKHAFEIAQDTFTIESITTPVGFVGDTVTFQITAKATNATNENIGSTIFDYPYKINSYGEPTAEIGEATENSSYNITKAILDSKFGALNSDSNSDKYNLNNYNSNNFRIDTYTSDNDTYITDTNNDGKSDSIAMSCIVLPTTYHITSTTETEVAKYYGSIEQALGAVTTSGYVIVPMQSFSYTPPGTTTAKTYSSGTSFNHTISSDVTLASGVHMLLPFDSTASYTVDDDSIPIPTQTTDVGALAYGTTKMKNAVTVEKGTFTVNGTLFIAGNVSGAQNGLIGSAVTNGNHSQITIESGAGIAASGNVYCYGFIDGAGTFNMNSGTLTTVFSVVEHRGGATYLGMTGHTLDEYLNIFNPPDPELQTSPFNRFYIASILAKLVSSSSAKVLGYTDLYALSEHNVTRINLVGNVNDGTDHLIDLTDGATVECKFVPNVTTNTSGTKYGQNQIKISGSATIKSLALTLTKLTVTVTLSTKDVLFPISHYWNVTLAPFPSGTAATVNSTAQDLRFLPGSALTVESGATLTADQIAIYGEGDHTYIAEHASSVGRRTYDVTTAANVVVKGTLTATNLGGLVRAGAAGAKVKATNNYASFKELYYAQDTGEDVTFMGQALGDKIDCSYTDVTFQAKGNALISSSIVSDIVMQSGIEYNAIAFGDSFAWVYDKTIMVKYDTDGDGTADTTKTQTAKSNVDVVLTGDFYPTLSKDYYEFGGWYSDAACSNAVSEGTAISSDITLYAKWNPINYNLNFSYKYSGSTPEEAPTLPASITFNDTVTSVNLPKPTGNYNFVGWFTAEDCNASSKVATISGSQLLEIWKGDATLYGLWTTEYTVTINFDYNVNYKSSLDDFLKENDLSNYPEYYTASEIFNNTIPTYDYSANDKAFLFNGWMYNGTVVSSYEDFVPENITGNLEYTLTASWTGKVKFTLDYNTETNTVLTGLTDVNGIWLLPGATQTLSDVNAGDSDTSNEFYFKQWTTTNCSVSGSTVTLSSTECSEATLKAEWGTKHQINCNISGISSKESDGLASAKITITFEGSQKVVEADSNGAQTIYLMPGEVTIIASVKGTYFEGFFGLLGYDNKGTIVITTTDADSAANAAGIYSATEEAGDKGDGISNEKSPVTFTITEDTGVTTVTISKVKLKTLKAKTESRGFPRLSYLSKHI